MNKFALVVLAMVVCMAGQVVSPAAYAASDCSALDAVAHRGFHPRGYDENTLAAFQLAIDNGFPNELDVWADADGELWVFHDRNTLRATGVDAIFPNLRSAQVASLRYKKAGSPIPTLDETLSLLANHPDTPAYIEVKQIDQIKRVADAVRDSGLIDSVFFTGYVYDTKKAAPDALLQMKAFSNPPSAATASAQGIDSIMLSPKDLSEASADSYQAYGVEVQGRTTNATQEWREDIKAGVDGILTDLPTDLRAFCPNALSPPKMVDFSPDSETAGATVKVTGDNFYDVSSVKFANATAPNFIVNSPTQLTVSVPENVPNNATVSVTTPNGTANSSRLFNEGASVDSFSPAAGPVDTTVSILGRSLSGVNEIRFGDQPAKSFTVISSTEVWAVVPANAPLAAPITAMTPNGNSTSSNVFTLGPSIESFTPSQVKRGETVTITGNAFGNTQRVKFGTTDSLDFTIISPTQIRAVVPADAPNKGKLNIRTPAGWAQSTDFYTVAPGIESFTPSQVNRGETVTITGNAFGNTQRVKFGTTDSLDFTIISPTQIRAVVPTDAPNKGKLNIRTPAGWAQSTDFYTVAPGIESFTPSQVNRGETVTITGNAFGNTQRVKFGTTDSLDFTVVSPTQIRAVVPTDAPDKGKLNIRTPAGWAQSTDFYNAD